ncbi:hypothetical protein Tco_0204587 [Tanacetum coccineum]
MVTESLEHAVLAKESSQPQSSYEAAALLIKFELKNFLSTNGKSESYLAALEHIQFYDGLIKYYDLEKSLFSTYDKVYSLKRSKKDKDNDKDPSVGFTVGFEEKGRQARMQNQPKVRMQKNQSLAHPKAPSLNQNLLENLFNQRNQSLRLHI